MKKQIEMTFYVEVDDEIKSDWFIKVLERLEKEFEGEMFHITGGYRIIKSISHSSKKDK